MKKLLTAIFLLCAFLNMQAVYSIQQKVETKDKTELLNIDWWNKFNDDNLVNYMLVAYENNQDLKTADLNTKQALQMTKMSFAKELPSLTFDGQYQREFESSEIRFGNTVIPNYNQSRFILPLTMAYEFDIWASVLPARQHKTLFRRRRKSVRFLFAESRGHVSAGRKRSET